MNRGERRPSPAGARAGRVVLLIASAVILGAGCAVGPYYQRPATDVPALFARRAVRPAPMLRRQVRRLKRGRSGGWRTRSVGYVTEALTNNWDVRGAAARVLQAEAAARVARSEFFPTIAAGGDVVTTRSSQRGPSGGLPGINPERTFGDAYLALPAYELDLWGRLRRANEAARARLLANRAAQETVRVTVVAQVATAYLQLLQLDAELAIARQSLENRRRSLELTTAREAGGVASLQDVVQARILVATAESAIADTLRQSEQKENELCLLLGRSPGPIVRGRGLEDQPVPASLPAGLPSELLERRPDLRVAEQQSVAANADIGQARAAFFPEITLTGNLGYQSVSLGDLFTGPARTWQFGPTATLPLFTGGRLRGNLKGAEARYAEALAVYRGSVENAFREVSDGLIAHQRSRETYDRQDERTHAHRQPRNSPGCATRVASRATSRCSTTNRNCSVPNSPWAERPHEPAVECDPGLPRAGRRLGWPGRGCRR